MSVNHLFGRNEGNFWKKKIVSVNILVLLIEVFTDKTHFPDSSL